MKTGHKLLIGLPVIILLTIAFCLVVAGEFKKKGSVSATGNEVVQAGRVPAFSIITIKGRAFAAQKPEVIEAQEATIYSAAKTAEQKAKLFPIAYKLISRGLISR
jgi:ABC-type Co2+ transport system permease subunit